MMRFMVLLMLTCLFLVGCGQKGSLYLPDDTQFAEDQ